METKRVALYARVSTVAGQSPEMQRVELREYAARRGWRVFLLCVGLEEVVDRIDLRSGNCLNYETPTYVSLHSTDVTNCIFIALPLGLPLASARNIRCYEYFPGSCTRCRWHL